MSFINDYQPKEYSQSFDVADGEHLVLIEKVDVQNTKNNNQMLVVQLKVQDSNGVPYFDRYVAGEYFDQNVTRLFDAYGIRRGDFNFNNWIGKKAKAMFVHKEETFVNNQGMTVTANRCNLKTLIVADKPQATPQQQLASMGFQPASQMAPNNMGASQAFDSAPSWN